MDEVRITLRLPASIHARLTAQAKSARRSLNSEIVLLLEEGLGVKRTEEEPHGGQPNH